jgi:mannose-1-phosphate guanylyltransferase
MRLTNMRWALILAGGNGSRLQSLTRLLTGDDRPKQFCPLLGDKTLLAQTRARIALNVDPTRTACVVTRAHAPYYSTELADMAPRQIVEQPANRGTAAAIAYGVARVAAQDTNATIAMFPADHYYEDTETLRLTVDRAYQAAQDRPGRVFLLGSHASCPEVEYGWIEPGRALSSTDGQISKVSRFWEKPSLPVAEALLERGCLWNMFIMVGSVAAFRSLLYSSLPAMANAFELAENNPRARSSSIAELYQLLPSADFSRAVLSRHTARIGVIRVPHIGWTDLGQPARVRSVLAARGGTSSAIGVAS